MTQSARFVGGNERRRMTHFDESVEGAMEFLDDSYAEDVMGTDVVWRYINLVSRLRLPNFTNGTVGISHFDDSDIPFIPVFEGDDFRIDEAELAPNEVQRQALETRFNKWVEEYQWPPHGVDAYKLEHGHFKQMGGDISSDVPLRDFAHSRQKWSMVGRPLLVENGEVHVSRFTPVMVHELTHLEQYETTPFWRHKDTSHLSVGMEVVAYRIQCMAMYALHLMGRGIELLDTVPHAAVYDQYASDIDAITSRHVGNQIDFKFTLPMVMDLLAFDPTITGEPVSS